MKIVFLSLPAHGRCSFPAYSAAVRHTATASAGIESGGFSVYIYSQIHGELIMNKDTLIAAAVNAITVGLIAYALQIFIMRSDQTYALWFAVMLGAAAGLGYFVGRAKTKK